MLPVSSSRTLKPELVSLCSKSFCCNILIQESGIIIFRNYYPTTHSPSNDSSEPHVDQAEEHEDEAAHEGVEDLEGRVEVWEGHGRESDVGHGSHGPGGAVEEDEDHEAVGEGAHLLQDAGLPDGGRRQVTDHYQHRQEAQLSKMTVKIKTSYEKVPSLSVDLTL